MTEHVAITTSGGVVRVCLARPGKHNAITMEMWMAIANGLDRAKADPDVRALVITGEGGSFSAGADLKSIKDADGTPSAEYRAIALTGLTAIVDFPWPTLARIDGHCMGAGVNIALACDVRFTTPGSTFAIPAARHGLVYDDWSIARLVELTGSGQASRLLYSGVTIDGREAARIGLAELCADDLPAAADAYLAAVLSGNADSITSMRARIRGETHGRHHT